MAKAGKRQKRVSPTQKPEDMSLEEWQICLRRDLATTGRFRLVRGSLRTRSNAGAWTAQVRNLDNQHVYDLELRGLALHDNSCTCPDFAINTLGICKHIEFALKSLRRKRPTRQSLEKGIIPNAAEVVVRYEHVRRLWFRGGRKTSPSALQCVRDYFHKEPSGYFLDALDPDDFDRFVERFRQTGSVLRICDDVRKMLEETRARQESERAVCSQFHSGVRSPAWKGLLKVDLYPYQKEGALFAAKRGRSLIADEMGLGKTIQAIAAAEILRRSSGIGRVLIICPTSLKHQWRLEIDRFSGESVEVIEGHRSRRKECLVTPTFFKIANYDVVHRDLEELNSWKPDLIILDEAQRIKNWKTKAAQAVKRLDSRYCLVLTGTPLENRIEELHSLMEFVDHFHFGPLFRFLHKHQLTDKDGKVIGYTQLDKINADLKNVLIRRTKAQVLEQLPPRVEKTLLLPMTSEQAAHHEENANVVARIVAKWRQFRFLSDRDQKRLMSSLQFMRMSCNSTYLLDPKSNHQKKFTELGKILRDLLESTDNKVVIFSQWLKTHELIIEQAEKRRWGYVFFHGGLTGSKRKRSIEAFRSDPDCRLFLSTDAGGVGLNLQAANVVINMDQPWNPAVLEQRIGRIHRLGQTRPVQVFNLVSKESIEEGMLKTLDFKRSIFSGVLDGSQAQVLLGGTRLGRFIESVEDATKAGKAPSGTKNEGTVTPPLGVTVTPPGASPSTAAPLLVTAEVMKPWEHLVQTGLLLLQSLSETRSFQSGAHEQLEPRGSLPASIGVERDQTSGETFVKIKAPPPEVVDAIAKSLQNWLSAPQKP